MVVHKATLKKEDPVPGTFYKSIPQRSVCGAVFAYLKTHYQSSSGIVRPRMRAGQPPATQLGGRSLLTKLLGCTTTPSPMVTPAMTMVPEPIQQSLPMVMACSRIGKRRSRSEEHTSELQSRP